MNTTDVTVTLTLDAVNELDRLRAEYPTLDINVLENVFNAGRNNGHTEGHEEGYEEGYDNGFSDRDASY